MNELQKTEFEILKSFIEVCQKLNLRYYLVCGTALGAVKYGGFIPWDDDVDVALPREDYRIFCEEAPCLLPDYYFLQNHLTDPAYPGIYSKIRDSRTTYIEISSADLPINHGIYIDVFPLDGYPTDAMEAAKLERKKMFYRLKLASAYSITEKHSVKAKLLLRCERLLGFHRHTQKNATLLENILSQWDTSSSDLWCNHGNWQGRLEYSPRKHYGESTGMLFEGLPVRVPEQFDAYLTQKYGDWRAELPLHQQKGHHDYLVCDPKKPYTEYVSPCHSRNK